MAKISACIISFNEEAKLEACLKSLVPVVDEIVVVDSNSTDGTVEIARRYTERVYLQEFLGHIEQKNLAVDKAEHDWVLSLDCDERLSPELQASILAVKEGLGDRGAYEMPRKNFYIYRWLNHCWYPEYRTRLFHRGHARWGGVNPHDKVLVEDGATERLAGDIHHFSYDSLSQHLKTIDHFTDIASKEIVESGRSVTPLTPVTHASVMFVKTYFLKQGFRDGFAGLCVATLSACYTFVKYAKVLVARYQGAVGKD